MATICSPFLFHAVLFSLHATKILGHDVGNCPLHKDCSEDAGAGAHAAELPEGVWRDGGARKAELPGRDVGAPLAGKDAGASPTVGRFMLYLVCSGIKAPVDVVLMFSQCAVPAGAGPQAVGVIAWRGCPGLCSPPLGPACLGLAQAEGAEVATTGREDMTVTSEIALPLPLYSPDCCRGSRKPSSPHFSILNMPFSSYCLSVGRRRLSLDPRPQESDIQFLLRC